MEKESKSCTGVLLRADLTDHGHLTLFGRSKPICPVRSALIRKHVEDFDSFSIMFYYLIGTTYKNLFCPVHISGLSLSVIN